MALEIEGTIVRKMAVQKGESARGPWSKQDFIIEYQEGSYPSQVCFNVWGEEKVHDLEKHQIGDHVKVSFNLNSREYNGRWYNDIRAWKIEPVGPAQQMPPAYAEAPAGTAPAPSNSFEASDDNTDDLPF